MNDSCYVIAEFGSNHLGNRDDAINAIYAAAHCGADAIKYQLFKLKDILVNPEGNGRPGECGDPRTELPYEWIPALAETCKEHKIDFLCTPFSSYAVAALNPYVEMWKIGSFEHKRIDIWNAVRATGKPIIAAEGRNTVNADFRLYCVSKYPTPAEDIYLPDFMNVEHGCVQGFSDHTTSTIIPAFAVARGARIIEKHFRLDQTPIDSPDYPHSLNPRQFAEMVENIRLAETTCWRQPPAERTLIAYPNRRE